MPKVSVIMPAYNAEKYIGEAIDSILGQTYTDYEFIILNDCSKDNTEQIILSYTDKRIVYVKNEENMGVAKTLNRGLDIACGEYIARMDSDDISQPDRLEKQVKFLEEHPDVAAVGSAVMRFGVGRKQELRRFPVNPVDAQLHLLFSPCFAHPSVMLRGAVLREYTLRYEPRWEGTEDYALWWELGKYGKVCALPDCLLHYRLHPSQVTASNSRRNETVFKPFAQKRMEDIGVNCNDEQVRILFDYTSAKQLTVEELEKFMSLLRSVSDSPIAKRRFGGAPLKKFLARTVCDCIEEERFSFRERRKLHGIAGRKGINTIPWLCKTIGSRALRRFRK